MCLYNIFCLHWLELEQWTRFTGWIKNIDLNKLPVEYTDPWWPLIKITSGSGRWIWFYAQAQGSQRLWLWNLDLARRNSISMRILVLPTPKQTCRLHDGTLIYLLFYHNSVKRRHQPTIFSEHRNHYGDWEKTINWEWLYILNHTKANENMKWYHPRVI